MDTNGIKSQVDQKESGKMIERKTYTKQEIN